MPNRNTAPVGSPCWTDLWTSDVEGSRKFYSDIFGWEAQEPNAEFGGYFMFTRNGVPVAGGMGDMGEIRADNTWKVYLATDDFARTAKTAEAEGGQLIAPPMAVADLGTQAGPHRPDRRQPRRMAARDIPGVHRAERAGRSQLVRTTDPRLRAGPRLLPLGLWLGDGCRERHRRVPLHGDEDPSGQGELAGIMDAAGFLPEGSPVLLGRLLGGRRPRGHRRQGRGRGRLGFDRPRGHPLWPHSDGERPGRGRVQVA